MDDVGDHGAAWAADKDRCEEISHRKDESKGGSGDQARERERQDYAEKCGALICAEVLGGFDQRTGNVFERGVDREENERSVDVREHEDHGEGAVEKEAERFAGDVEVLKEAVEDAFAAEDGFPGVTANQVADPERDDDELVEEFFAGAGVERNEIRERVAEEDRKERDRSGYAHGAEEDAGVERVGGELVVVVEIPVMDDETVLDGPETVGEHQGVRKKQEEADPEQRREGDQRFVEL